MAASWQAYIHGSPSLLRLIPLVARRSSREVEETAQVTGTSDEKGKEGDEEAGAHYPV